MRMHTLWCAEQGEAPSPVVEKENADLRAPIDPRQNDVKKQTVERMAKATVNSAQSRRSSRRMSTFFHHHVETAEPIPDEEDDANKLPGCHQHPLLPLRAPAKETALLRASIFTLPLVSFFVLAVLAMRADERFMKASYNLTPDFSAFEADFDRGSLARYDIFYFRLVGEGDCELSPHNSSVERERPSFLWAAGPLWTISSPGTVNALSLTLLAPKIGAATLALKNVSCTHCSDVGYEMCLEHLLSLTVDQFLDGDRTPSGDAQRTSFGSSAATLSLPSPALASPPG
jgi:hypothetical protein